MNRGKAVNFRPLAALAAVFAYFLYFHGITQVGFLSTDEPRYAAIGRHMAQSGDWITPNLWGTPWFEKPPLLYWMTGLGTLWRLPDEAAARLPVALLSVAFLILFYRVLSKMFCPRAAWFATGILATSAGWVSYSQVAVTDLPLAATFSAAMFVALPWLEGGSPRRLWIGGVLMGLAVLAKGLVPLALALPLLWFGRKRWKDLLLPAVAMIAVAAPWYAAVASRHGTEFLLDFFWKHHFQRAVSDVLQHQQAFWYYIPVLLAGLFPWTPLLFSWDRAHSDSRPALRFFATWAIFGLVLFSAIVNKLPGYILPILPPIAALLGVRLDRSEKARWLLIPCALLLAVIPLIADILPAALHVGIGKSGRPAIHIPATAAAAALAGMVWTMARRSRLIGAFSIVLAASACGVVYLKVRTYPVLDATVSARGTWKRLALRPGTACSEDLDRDAVYGLSYYLGEALPSCEDDPRPVRLAETQGEAAIQ